MQASKILILLISVCLFGCNFSGKLTRRYYRINVEPIGNNIKNYVSVDTYILEKEEANQPADKSVFDLSDRGQKELIEQLGINETSNDKLIASMSSSLSQKTSKNIEVIDYTKSEKRVLITTRNLSHWPADRISKITVNLKITNPDIKILSCNRLTTEFQSIDLGKLNYSNSNQFELNANATNGIDISRVQSKNDEVDNITSSQDKNTSTASKLTTGLNSTNTKSSSQGLSGKFDASRTFSEEVQLRQRIVSLNATISQNTLSLYQESISGIDLTGNILADIIFDSQKKITVSVYSFSDLLKDDKFNDPDKIKVKETYVQFYNLTNDITADLCFQADYRHVGNRHKTISESDDWIDLWYGETESPQSVTLISKDKLKPKLWSLIDSADPHQKPYQIFNPTNSGAGELTFSSIAEAKAFVIWVKNKKASVLSAGGILGTLGFKLLKPDGTSVDDPSLQRIQIAVSQI